MPEETGSTFAENAALKARSLAKQTGEWSLADDSGLCVEALGGAPGVRSARYAGEGAGDAANNAALLDALKDVPDAGRGARFVCALALSSPRGEVEFFEGTCEGTILRAPRGGGGFGYDPLFFDPVLQRTFAEASPARKLSRSHRGKALEALRGALSTRLARGASGQ